MRGSILDDASASERLETLISFHHEVGHNGFIPKDGILAQGKEPAGKNVVPAKAFPLGALESASFQGKNFMPVMPGKAGSKVLGMKDRFSRKGINAGNKLGCQLLYASFRNNKYLRHKTSLLNSQMHGAE